MKNKYTKGDYLYLQNKKKVEIIKTMVLTLIKISHNFQNPTVRNYFAENSK